MKIAHPGQSSLCSGSCFSFQAVDHAIALGSALDSPRQIRTFLTQYSPQMYGVSMAIHLPHVYIRSGDQYWVADSEPLRELCRHYSGKRVAQARSLQRLNNPDTTRRIRLAFAGVWVTTVLMAIGLSSDDRHQRGVVWLGVCGNIFSTAILGGNPAAEHLHQWRVTREANALQLKIQKAFRENREGFSVAVEGPGEGDGIIFMGREPIDEPELRDNELDQLRGLA